MAPWIECSRHSEYMDGEEIERSLCIEQVTGKQIIRSVANSKAEQRQLLECGLALLRFEYGY